MVVPQFSPEDQDLAAMKWYDCNDYAGRVYPKKLYAHRLVVERILGRRLQNTEVVDHRDCDKLNNRRENLAAVTRQQNAQNRAAKQFRGTVFHKHLGKWGARICINYKTIHLGLFATRSEAAERAKQARKQYNFHGES